MSTTFDKVRARFEATDDKDAYIRNHRDAAQYLDMDVIRANPQLPWDAFYLSQNPGFTYNDYKVFRSKSRDKYDPYVFFRYAPKKEALADRAIKENVLPLLERNDIKDSDLDTLISGSRINRSDLIPLLYVRGEIERAKDFAARNRIKSLYEPRFMDATWLVVENLPELLQKGALTPEQLQSTIISASNTIPIDIVRKYPEYVAANVVSNLGANIRDFRFFIEESNPITRDPILQYIRQVFPHYHHAHN